MGRPTLTTHVTTKVSSFPTQCPALAKVSFFFLTGQKSITNRPDRPDGIRWASFWSSANKHKLMNEGSLRPTSMTNNKILFSSVLHTKMRIDSPGYSYTPRNVCKQECTTDIKTDPVLMEIRFLWTHRRRPKNHQWDSYHCLTTVALVNGLQG